MDIKQITSEIGHKRLAASLGCGETAISNAVKRGLFPSAWFPIVKALGSEKSIEIPESMFNFKDIKNEVR